MFDDKVEIIVATTGGLCAVMLFSIIPLAVWFTHIEAMAKIAAGCAS